MNLGKLTIHTACQYIDRMIYLHHKDTLSNNAFTFPDQAYSSAQQDSAAKQQIKVITPRQRIVMQSNQKEGGGGGGSSRGTKLMQSQSPRINRKALSTTQELELKA